MSATAHRIPMSDPCQPPVLPANRTRAFVPSQPRKQYPPTHHLMWMSVHLVPLDCRPLRILDYLILRVGQCESSPHRLCSGWKPFRCSGPRPSTGRRLSRRSSLCAHLLSSSGLPSVRTTKRQSPRSCTKPADGTLG